MPEFRVDDVCDGPLDRVFGALFGAEFFAAIHAAEGHSAAWCSEWVGGADGEQCREAAYTLPEEGVTRMLRQGPTRVSVREELSRSDGEMVVVSSANNSGGSLAEMTKVMATYTLRAAPSGPSACAPPGRRGAAARTAVSVHVAFSFGAPLLVRAAVEAGMVSEMRAGYMRWYAFSHRWLRDLGASRRPAPKSASSPTLSASPAPRLTPESPPGTRTPPASPFTPVTALPPPAFRPGATCSPFSPFARSPGGCTSPFAGSRGGAPTLTPPSQCCGARRGGKPRPRLRWCGAAAAALLSAAALLLWRV